MPGADLFYAFGWALPRAARLITGFEVATASGRTGYGSMTR